jgi:hypothetical protein
MGEAKNMLTAITFAGIPLGIYLIILGIQARKKIDRYEFENRTDGGVVKFPDYEASRKHDWLKRQAANFPGLGVAILGLSIFILFIA